MDFKDLPHDVQVKISISKISTNSVSKVFAEALSIANNYEEFKEVLREKLNDLIGEARDAITNICD